MQILVCISSEKYSTDTLKFGLDIASALKADLSILLVRPQVSYRFKNEVRVATRKVEEWQIETQEVKVIQTVQDFLVKEGFVLAQDGSVPIRHLPKSDIHGAFEYHIYGAEGENVRIRVREGDVVGNIIHETEELVYDLVVIGAPKDGGKLARQIIQYVDVSVLIVKNIPRQPRRLLLCLDQSDASRRAQDFAIRVARTLGAPIDILCIYSYPWEEHAALNVAEKAQRLMKRFRIPYTIRLRRGPVARTILQEEEPHHIVVTGNSRRSSLSQFFFGSNPVKIGREGKNPVLVVK